MNLSRLHLERSRGLASPILLEGLSPGFNVIVGSNGSGKSSLCRAVAALLWDTDDFQGAVSATWSLGREEFTARRESGAPPRWSSADQKPPTALPDGRFRRCFTLSVDDFLTDRETDAEIQREIGKELAAGFDLSLVLADRKRHSPAASAVSQKANALVAASGRAERVRDEHRKLLSAEQRLQEQRVQLDEASRARSESTLFDAALELARARDALGESTRLLEPFPDRMEELHGDEHERLGNLRADLKASRERLEEVRRGAAEAAQALALTGLERPVAPEDLQQLRAREKNLQASKAELTEAEREVARAVADLTQARRVLRREGVAGLRAELGPERWQALELLLRELDGLAAACGQLEGELAEVLDEEPSPEDQAPYERGIALLSSWLEGGTGAPPFARLQVLATLAIGLTLLLLGLFEATGAFAFIAGGLALTGLGLWQWFAGQSDERAPWVREFLGLPFEGPESWETLAVTRRLGELLRAHEVQQRRRVRRAAAQRIERRLEKRRVEHAGKLAELDSCCAGCGLSPQTALLGLAEILGALARQTRAETDLARAQARKEDGKVRYAQELARANGLLEAHGVAAASDAEELRSRIDGLDSRESSRQVASRQLLKSSAEEERAARQLQDREAALGAYVGGLGLGESGEAELLRRLEQLPSWRQARETWSDAQREVARLERVLEEHPHLRELEAAEAQSALDRNAELASHYEPLWKEIIDVKSAIEKARKGHELEDALAEEELTREALLDTREELFEAAAADFLLESIAREHRNLAQPDILRRAGEWFAEFTHHRYRLDLTALSPDGSRAFEIHETSGELKAVRELSSGTLSQLCLALRLAVAQSVEGTEELPLLLDEALTNSDPLRFREVVRSLVTMAAGGRQILFLTADPDDAARLSAVVEELGCGPVQHFDLDRERSRSAAAEEVLVRAIPPIPAPEPQETSEAYAARLRVPRIDPFAGVDALHPYYLCRDDLAGLHELLCQRVETVGNVRSLLKAHKSLWTAASRERFEALRQVGATWLENYRVGRAPRLAPEVLRDGPAGKTVFIEALVEINTELGGDAMALIESLNAKGKDRDPRLRGFKSAKLSELRADLEQRGLFTPDAPLDAESRVEPCLATARSAVEQGVLRREDVVQLANALEQWCAEPGSDSLR